MVFVVTSQVADLRREPIMRTDLGKDLLQETQLLYGDTVEVLDQNDSWMKVHVIDQPVFTEESGWSGYVGWIEKQKIMPMNSSCEL